MHASSNRAQNAAIWGGVAVPIAFTSFLSGGTDLQALPLRLMYTSALSLHPHSCDVLLTDLQTLFSSPPAATVLRYALPYSDESTEKIPGRTVTKYTCNNRLATEAKFLSEVAAGRHSCAGHSRFHIALLDSDVLVVGSLARLFQEQVFSVAFTGRSHPSMPINNGMRLVSGRSNESLAVASRFYNHWFAMVRLMEQTSRKPLGDESFMHGPIFWHEQKAVALLLGHDRSDAMSLAPFQPVRSAALAPPVGRAHRAGLQLLFWPARKARKARRDPPVRQRAPPAAVRRACHPLQGREQVHDARRFVSAPGWAQSERRV